MTIRKLSSNDWTKNWNGQVGTKVTSMLIWVVVTCSILALTVLFFNYEQKVENRYKVEAFNLIQKSNLVTSTEIKSFYEAQKLSFITGGKILIDGAEINWGSSNESGYNFAVSVGAKEYRFHGHSFSTIKENEKKNFLFFLICLVIVASGIIKTVVHIILSRPQKQLIEVINEVQSGDFDVRIDDQRKDEFGEISKVFNAAMDTIEDNETKLKDFAEKAQIANHAKTIFLANMSHEIRTPLTSILGFTSIIRHKGRVGPDDMKNIQAVEKNSEHLMGIINEILDMSKIEQNKMQVEIMDVELVNLLTDLETLISIQAVSKGLNFELNSNFPLPTKVLTDPTRIKQVLLNICGNAIKFTEKGSVILDVSWNEELSKLEFKVTDTGIGISEDKIRHIFEPFSQADSSTTRVFGGTGLGLYISKNISEVLGGSLSVSSELGKGSQFTVSVDAGPLNYLKFTNEAVKIVPEVVIRPLSSFNFGGTLLVVEDTADIRDLIQDMLIDSNIEIKFAVNGVEAVEKTKDTEYDLILIDAQMPVMGGVEATKIIRKSGYSAPIVFLSANAMETDIQAYKEAGSNDQLAKPFGMQELFQVLDKYLPNTGPKPKAIVKNSKSEFMQKRAAATKSYIKEVPELIQQIDSLVNKLEFKELIFIAHSLGGSSSVFNLNQTGRTCKSFEKYLKGLKPTMETFYAKIESSFEEDKEEENKKVI